jgi:ElaB/YqjD/DUF883 family membrane-anchored ribosome-binding protein
MATQGSGSSKAAAVSETLASAGKRVEAEQRRDAAAEDFHAQIDVLKEEVANLREQIARAGGHSFDAAKKAASAGVDHLKSQGEMTLEDLRSNANDLEGQLVATVREKPVTAMACALGAGFLLALLTRR